MEGVEEDFHSETLWLCLVETVGFSLQSCSSPADHLSTVGLLQSWTSAGRPQSGGALKETLMSESVYDLLTPLCWLAMKKLKSLVMYEDCHLLPLASYPQLGMTLLSVLSVPKTF